MIKVNNIAFSYGHDPVFEGVSFIISDGQKVGVVGPNGSGKSTLFRLLTGVEEINTGTIEVVGKIGTVPQEVKHDPIMISSRSVREYINPESKVEDFELAKMLAGLELDNMDLNLPPQNLSGGQKTKLALARALIDEPDTLMLDEPTNFMDKAGKRWVMNFLSNYPKTLLLISHDIKLINESIDKVLAINSFNKQIEEYKGNYTDFLRLKAERDAQFARHVMIEQKKIDRLEKGLAKHRGFRSKKGKRRKVVIERRIERAKAVLPDLPPEAKKITAKFPPPVRMGEIPIRFEGVSKSYGENKVLDDLSFTVRRGEKFVLIGPNGSGKSTINKIIVGMAGQDSGEVTINDSVSIGYYSQEFETFDFEKRVLEFVSDECNLDESRSRGPLARFLFDKDKVNQRIETLSGGEKTRLSIALLMLQGHNLLILDEPTTYLDVLSQRVILDALKDYEGTIILVSHSEQFVRELAPTRALVMPEASLKLWSDDLLESVLSV